MINRAFEGIFKGVLDHFKAFGASSFKEVKENAGKHFSDVQAEEAERIAAFTDKLKNNNNLSDDQVKAMVKSKEAFSSSNMFFNSLVDGFTSAYSLAGGTVNYGVSKMARGVFTKDGRQSIADGADILMKSRSGRTGVAGTGVMYADEVADGVVSAGSNTIEAIKNAPLEEFTGTALGGSLVGTGSYIGAAMPSLGYVTREAGATLSDIGRGAVGAVQEGVPSAINALKKTGASSFGALKDGTGDAAGTARYLWSNRDNRVLQAGVLATGAALVPAAYEQGINEANYKSKMTAVVGSNQYSYDGGGTFLRDNFRPGTVDNLGASGDLVFALHNLRNGG